MREKMNDLFEGTISCLDSNNSPIQDDQTINKIVFYMNNKKVRHFLFWDQETNMKYWSDGSFWWVDLITESVQAKGCGLSKVFVAHILKWHEKQETA